jgi:anti-sigma-K factor RskA
MLALAPQQLMLAPEAVVPLAVIDGADRVAMLGARTLAGGRYLRVDHFGLQAAADLALELWLLSGGVGRPESLGLLAVRDGVTILSLARPIAEGDFLAVSAEPSGGAPTIGPSGPVILTARVGIKF